ncbi:MAG: tRNA 2-methylthio-N6-isopentenyl adenosine(37) hydroxylase MiaE [Proteobacteria bacterium]|nr:tRNA 2-methylthio-N6-isopentenyl adenosine(37) hydroxylase MiaE [Pseudomonadota bacterium]
MLGLLQATDPRWARIAEQDLDLLLSDHAHCELKAAHSALSLVARYGGEAPELVEPLLALAREETRHFHEVHVRLGTRGQTLGKPSSDGYVRSLHAMTKMEHPEVPALLDRLLVAALVEGRSCERFKLLSKHLADAQLRRFYRELMAAEARHFRLFIGLTEGRFGRETTRKRLATLIEREAILAQTLPLAPRIHG